MSALARINYSSAYESLLHDLYAAVSSRSHLTSDILQMTERLLEYNAANYSVWLYRRVCLSHLDMQVDSELDYMDAFAEENPKNYQIWHHRRVVCKNVLNFDREVQFTTKVLQVDKKNYHAWAHRQWLVQLHLKSEPKLDLTNEINFALNLLIKDARNNSAWNYIWFLLNHNQPLTYDVLKSSNNGALFNFILTCLTSSKFNESVWHFFRGISDILPSLIVRRIIVKCINQNSDLNYFALSIILNHMMCSSDSLIPRSSLIQLIKTVRCLPSIYYLGEQH